MADIAEILLRVKLSAELYQTDHIRAAISALYAHILLFFKQLASWLNRSKTRKIISAIRSPFKLGLKTSVDEVKRCALILDAAADLASKSEMRSMHVLMHAVFDQLASMQAKFDDLSTSLDKRLEVFARESHHQDKYNQMNVGLIRNYSESKPILEEIHLNVLDMKPRIIDIQFNQAMGILKPRNSPLAALRSQQIIARRSQPWMSANADTANLLTRIGDWIFSSESSLLVLRAPVRAESKAKEIAVEMIGLLQPTATRVAWYLSTTTSADHGMSIVEILKGLAHQLVCFDPENINRNLNANLTATKLQHEHSEREWADLVYMILQYLSYCFIFIEAEDFYKTMSQEESFSETMLSIFHSLIARSSEEGLRVKILLVEYGKSSNHGTTFSAKEPFVNIVPLQPSVPVPASRRRSGTRSAFQSAGWLNLRHKVMKEQ